MDAFNGKYKTFRKLRDDGVTPAGTRFQVCQPGLFGAAFPVYPKYQIDAAHFEPLPKLDNERPS